MGPQEDFIETVVTCEGDFYDPAFHNQLLDLKQGLQNLIGKDEVIVTKVEPWNSVRITFNIPKEAAVRLRQLAEQGHQALRQLGILAVQIGDCSISLTIAGKNNETAELVLRTAPGSMSSAVTPAASGACAASAFELPGAVASNVESTRRNIKRYLESQNPPLYDEMFNPQKAHGLGHGMESKGPTLERHSPPDGVPLHMVNYAMSSPNRSPASLGGPVVASASSSHGRSPPAYPASQLSMHQSHPHLMQKHQANQMSPISPKYPTPPPSVSNPSSPGLRASTFGMFPPGSQTVNNLQPRVSATKDITSQSPLLVNLLQTQSEVGSHINNLIVQQQQQKGPCLPFDGVAPPKKRKRVKKRKDGTVKDGQFMPPVCGDGMAAVGAMQTSVPSTGLPISLPPHQLHTSQSTNFNPPPMTSQAHPTSALGALDSKSYTPVPSSPLRPSFSQARSPGARSHAQHMINPYTGQLELIGNGDNSSDGYGVVPPRPLIGEHGNCDESALQALGKLQPPPNPLVALQNRLIGNPTESLTVSSATSHHLSSSLPATSKFASGSEKALQMMDKPEGKRKSRRPSDNVGLSPPVFATSAHPFSVTPSAPLPAALHSSASTTLSTVMPSMYSCSTTPYMSIKEGRSPAYSAPPPVLSHPPPGSSFPGLASTSLPPSTHSSASSLTTLSRHNVHSPHVHDPGLGSLSSVVPFTSLSQVTISASTQVTTVAGRAVVCSPSLSVSLSQTPSHAAVPSPDTHLRGNPFLTKGVVADIRQPLNQPSHNSLQCPPSITSQPNLHPTFAGQNGPIGSPFDSLPRESSQTSASFSAIRSTQNTNVQAALDVNAHRSLAGLQNDNPRLQVPASLGQQPMKGYNHVSFAGGDNSQPEVPPVSSDPVVLNHISSRPGVNSPSIRLTGSVTVGNTGDSELVTNNSLPKSGESPSSGSDSGIASQMTGKNDGSANLNHDSELSSPSSDEHGSILTNESPHIISRVDLSDVCSVPVKKTNGDLLAPPPSVRLADQKVVVGFALSDDHSSHVYSRGKLIESETGGSHQKNNWYLLEKPSNSLDHPHYAKKGLVLKERDPVLDRRSYDGDFGCGDVIAPSSQLSQIGGNTRKSIVSVNLTKNTKQRVTVNGDSMCKNRSGDTLDNTSARLDVGVPSKKGVFADLVTENVQLTSETVEKSVSGEASGVDNAGGDCDGLMHPSKPLHGEPTVLDTHAARPANDALRKSTALEEVKVSTLQQQQKENGPGSDDVCGKASSSPGTTAPASHHLTYPASCEVPELVQPGLSETHVLRSSDHTSSYATNAHVLDVPSMSSQKSREEEFCEPSCEVNEGGSCVPSLECPAAQDDSELSTDSTLSLTPASNVDMDQNSEQVCSAEVEKLPSNEEDKESSSCLSNDDQVPSSEQNYPSPSPTRLPVSEVCSDVNQPTHDTSADPEIQKSPLKSESASEAGTEVISQCSQIHAVENTPTETAVPMEESSTSSTPGHDECVTSASGGTTDADSGLSKIDADKETSDTGAIANSPVVNHVSSTQAESSVDQSSSPASDHTSPPVEGEASSVDAENPQLTSSSTSPTHVPSSVSTASPQTMVTSQKTVCPLVNVFTVLPSATTESNPSSERSEDDKSGAVESKDEHPEASDAICNGPHSSLEEATSSKSQLEDASNCVDAVPLHTPEHSDNKESCDVAVNHVDGKVVEDDEKLGKGISIMKPLKDREDEVQDEEMVTTPDMKRVKLRQVNNKCREVEEMGKGSKDKSEGLITGEDPSDTPSPPPMVHADLSLNKSVQKTKQIKTPASSRTHTITVTPAVELVNKSEKTQLSHFVQKSLKTPTLIKSSHGIMDPCFTDNLTESVQKVMSLPSMDHDLPSSINHAKLSFSSSSKAVLKVAEGTGKIDSETENVHTSAKPEQAVAVNETVLVSTSSEDNKQRSPSPTNNESLVCEHSYSARLPGTSSTDETSVLPAVNSSHPEPVRAKTTPSTESTNVKEVQQHHESGHSNESKTEPSTISPVKHSSKFTAKSNNKFIRLDFSGHSSLSANEVSYIEPLETRSRSPDKKNESPQISAEGSTDTRKDSRILVEQKVSSDLPVSESVGRTASPSVTSERMATRSSGRRQQTHDDVDDQLKTSRGSKRKLTEDYSEEKTDTAGDLLSVDNVIIIEESPSQTKQPHASKTAMSSKKGVWKVENHRTMLTTRNTTKNSRKDAKGLSAGEELSEEDDGDKFTAEVDSVPLPAPISKRSVRACRVAKVDKSETSVPQPASKRRKASR